MKNNKLTRKNIHSTRAHTANSNNNTNANDDVLCRTNTIHGITFSPQNQFLHSCLFFRCCSSVCCFVKFKTILWHGCGWCRMSCRFPNHFQFMLFFIMIIINIIQFLFFLRSTDNAAHLARTILCVLLLPTFAFFLPHAEHRLTIWQCVMLF